MATLNGQSLFTSAISGLTNTYAAFLKESPNGISLNDLTNPSDKINTNNLNSSFISYLTTNFGKIDKNGDGLIDQNDLNKLSETISTKGMSYDEIVQLCAQQGSSTLLDTVLSYFNQIDTNNDGRVTNEEIAAFSSNAEKERLVSEYKSFKPSSMSLFYGSEPSDDENKSVLDSRYPNLNKTNK